MSLFLDGPNAFRLTGVKNVSSSFPLHDLHVSRNTHPAVMKPSLHLLLRLCDTMHHGPSRPGSDLLTNGASVTLLSKALLQARPSWPHKRYPKAKIQIFKLFDKRRYQRYLSLSCVSLCRPSRPAACVLRDKTQLWLLVFSLSNSKA
ncbi:hypothetical protein AMECASPLE_003984 [Ameca splendens]|uniref:Uncharacterized protein n=1 Tax=Ameca splendens TaxID=208324 RepID=A0ABV1A759_9TELE